MMTAKRVALAVAALVWMTAQAGETAPAAPAPAATPVAEAAANLSPEAVAIKTKMEKLFEASKSVNGTGKDTARKQIEGAMDWEKIASSCLGPPQWKKLAAKDRHEFQSLLKEVIVKTAYTRMDTFWDKTTYTFNKIDIKSGDAHVVSKFNASGDILTLDYYLAKKGGEWLVYDISYEDNRYSTNINEQLTAFLREKSFAQLLNNLKKRRDELASGKPAKKNG